MMNLRDQKKLTYSSGCFVCLWAGEDMVFWPQNLITTGWAGYLNVKPDASTRAKQLRSKHVTIHVCAEHMILMKQDWQRIAQQELDLEYLWNQYIERIEK